MTLEQARPSSRRLPAAWSRRIQTRTPCGSRREPGWAATRMCKGVPAFRLSFRSRRSAIVLLIACANVAGLLLARAAARRRRSRPGSRSARTRSRHPATAHREPRAVARGRGRGTAIGSWLTQRAAQSPARAVLFLSFNLDLGLDWRCSPSRSPSRRRQAWFSARSCAPGISSGSRAGVEGAVRRRAAAAGPAPRPGRHPSRALAHPAVAAGLCVRTLQQRRGHRHRVRPARVLTARMDLVRQRFSRGARTAAPATTPRPPRGHARCRRRRIRRDATLERRPMGEPRSPRRRPTRVQTFQNVVSPRYFDALNMPCVAGLSISDRDDGRRRRAWPSSTRRSRESCGRREPARQARDRSRAGAAEIVGVVRDIKGRKFLRRPADVLSAAFSALPVEHGVPRPNAVATTRRARRRPPARCPPSTKIVPVYAVRTMDEHVTATLTPQRLLAYLITGFGALALARAHWPVRSVGVHRDRATPEIGLRMAIGAHQADVMRLSWPMA